jgi:hypothetical protein
LQNIEIIEEISTKNRVARSIQIAGPWLSDLQLHLAGLPLDPATAATIRQASWEAYAAKSYLPRPSPLVDVGDAVLLGAGHKIATADIATAGHPGPIPEFLRRDLQAKRTA